MAVKLNKPGFDHPKYLIALEHVVVDGRDAWSQHQPSSQQENEFIRVHGLYGMIEAAKPTASVKASSTKRPVARTAATK